MSLSPFRKIGYKIRYILKRPFEAPLRRIIVFVLVSIMCFVWLFFDSEDYLDMRSTYAKSSFDLKQLEQRYYKEASILYEVEAEIAAKLFSAVHITCVVMSPPQNFKDKVVAVKATWGRRCNRLHIFSSKDDKDVNPLVLNMTEGRNHLWGKTKEAFKYVYAHHFDETDWVLKADDDTYIIMENLRYLLSGYSNTDPVWFGFRFNQFIKSGYMSGGGGYVLSKEAVSRFVEDGVGGSKPCKKDDTGAEDAEMGKCLDQLGIEAMEARDIFDREMFHPLTPESHINFQYNSLPWLNTYTLYPIRNGFNCCSDYSISFHYLTPSAMYALEYFIYHLKTVGKQDVVPFSYPFPIIQPEKNNASSKANVTKTNEISEETKNRTKVSEAKQIELENKVKESQNKTRDLKTENLGTGRKIKTTKTEINELIKRIKASENNIIDTKKKISELEKYIAAPEDKIISDQNKKDMKTKEITESGNNIKDNNESKMNDEVSKMKQSENEINNNKNKIKKIETKIINTEKQIQFEDMEVELKKKKYENEIIESRNKIQALESKIKNSENKQKSDESKAKELAIEMKEAETKIKNDHNKTQDLETKIKDSENKGKLVTEIIESKNETDEIENKIKELDNKRDMLKRIRDIQNIIKESESNKREIENELKRHEDKT